MPPLGPPRADDGPACRVCQCTQNNACIDDGTAPPRTPRLGQVGCAWAIVNDGLGPLCTACSGTDADAAFSLAKGVEQLGQLTNLSIAAAVRIAKALQTRVRIRRGLRPKRKKA